MLLPPICIISILTIYHLRANSKSRSIQLSSLTQLKTIQLSLQHGWPVPICEQVRKTSSLPILVAVNSLLLPTPLPFLRLYQVLRTLHMASNVTEVFVLLFRWRLFGRGVLWDSTDGKDGNYFFSLNSDIWSDQLMGFISGIPCSRPYFSSPSQLLWQRSD